MIMIENRFVYDLTSDVLVLKFYISL